MDREKLMRLLETHATPEPNTGCLLWMGTVDNDGYAMGRVDGKQFRVARAVCEAFHGPLTNKRDAGRGSGWPLAGHVRADNRWVNLRPATQTENNRNSSLKKNNTSGVAGVSWDTKREKWVAMITADRKQQSLGRFDTKEAAIAAREEAEKRLHGDFAVIKGAA